MSFPIIRNPLLPSPPSSKKKSGKLRRTEFFSSLQISAAASLKPSISTDSFRNFVTQTIHHISGANTRMNKRIMPSGIPKSATMGVNCYNRYPIIQEPLVHYNGSKHTLEELPVEKLTWIKEDQLNNGIRNPLSHYHHSIVLRKPLKRILQVIATDSSKVRSFRCTVQVNDETCAGSFVTSEKSGKNGSIVQFDETFLFDIEEPTTATISVFAKHKSLFGAKQQEVCLGKETIEIGLNLKQKTAERFVLNDNPNSGQSNDYQLLVVHGTYVSRRSQILLNNTVLFEDYITAHTHNGQFQRWERFWGVLHATQFELYDFEYKNSRPPLYVIPLDQFVSVSSIEEDEEDHWADIGSRGLVLEFTSRAIERDQKVSGCRMYLLPESTASAREWKDKLNYAASIFDELGGELDYDDCGSSLYSFDDQHSSSSSRLTVPSKLLW
ncbi:hypothetical protein G6F29_009015 [Rhizopus arrhizus]|uniref:PH domain-containing protein n=1 Tax=Rhizopus oryzae TaxID=64495 RepID=A0A9P6WZ89_RHIOR|nr:hypothetical protein G6F22_007406 [Rhizopus arrhizus]KAG0821728.1 hypothetical protein G6F19_011774 [Rhizopus arrhizus]KAG0822454.1 hypothetical protein G6F18_011766 [Rhizopus arrhizus]KAG0863442.1 hypothetical protein G6F16_011801 [Rhizopus arrhizus]KAG0908493.1 hypothetical protein G6F33_009649 [Rhizopus arrhizus]